MSQPAPDRDAEVFCRKCGVVNLVAAGSAAPACASCGAALPLPGVPAPPPTPSPPPPQSPLGSRLAGILKETPPAALGPAPLAQDRGAPLSPFDAVMAGMGRTVSPSACLVCYGPPGPGLTRPVWTGVKYESGRRYDAGTVRVTHTYVSLRRQQLSLCRRCLRRRQLWMLFLWSLLSLPAGAIAATIAGGLGGSGGWALAGGLGVAALYVTLGVLNALNAETMLVNAFNRTTLLEPERGAVALSDARYARLERRRTGP